jgi:hypothetical protein
MANTHSIKGLHLRYRLWIAELNFDINVLHIFEDYLIELSAKDNIPEIKKGIAEFVNKFIKHRNEIDELRHEMHLIKMKLAAHARLMKMYTHANYKSDNHQLLKKRYTAFKKTFAETKKAFSAFEDKWLN